MNTILIPIDGSAQSLKALNTALDFEQPRHANQFMLLTVLPPLMGRARGLYTHDELSQFYLRESEYMLAAAKERLNQSEQKYETRMVIGSPAEMIHAVARNIKAKKIYMGSRGRGAGASILLGSVATQLATMTDLPLTLVNTKE